MVVEGAGMQGWVAQVEEGGRAPLASSAGSGGEAAVLCWTTGGAASTGRRDGSGRGERRGEHPGHVERVGAAGSRGVHVDREHRERA